MKLTSFIFILLAFMSFEKLSAQCPDYFFCEGSGYGWGEFGLGFYSTDPSGIPLATPAYWLQDVEIFLEEGSSWNGTYQIHNTTPLTANGFTIELIDGFVEDCPEFLPFVSIDLPTGENCVYEFGVLCEGCPQSGNPDCEDFIEECEQDLADLIIRNSDIVVDGCEQWTGDCGANESIGRNGIVAIGVTEAPADGSYKLFVRDGIVTEQFKLAFFQNGEWGALDGSSDSRAWCDYVFEENYPLMPLNDVETFIKKNKHLPNTISAAEVEEQGGIHLRETVFNHQEKIEELFLHLFDLNKQMEGMEEILDNQ